MNFLSNAMAAVQRNAGALLIYMGAVVLAQAAGVAADLFITGGQHINPETLTLSDRVLALCVQLATAPIVAVGAAVAFARIGKEMDRPLWRSSGDRDALRRFFQLWFTLSLMGTALLHLVGFAASANLQPLAILFSLFYLLLFLLTIPIGACIMFAGTFHWKELGSVMAPLAHNMLRTFGLILINLFQYSLIIQVDTLRGGGDGLQWLWLTPVVTVIGAYLDCLVFAGTWILCIEHRNVDEDPDFDF